MKVGEDHFIEGVRKDIIPGGSPMPVRRLAVIHFTSGATAQSSINFWRTHEAHGACAHIIIDRDGSITQCRPFNKTAGHAGESRWQDPNSKRFFGGLNACSIGIELANGGDDLNLIKRWSKMPPYLAKHRNGGGIESWERFPSEQLAACFQVTRAIVVRYKLDDVSGHDCVAPERKNDPGPAFPMDQLREFCGFSGLPRVFWP